MTGTEHDPFRIASAVHPAMTRCAEQAKIVDHSAAIAHAERIHVMDVKGLMIFVRMLKQTPTASARGIVSLPHRFDGGPPFVARVEGLSLRRDPATP